MAMATPTIAPGPEAPSWPARKSTGRASRSWLAALPLLLFIAFAFGIPAIAVVVGAFTVEDPVTSTSRLGIENMTDSLQGAYRTSLWASVKLSAFVAVVGGVLGTFLAQAVVASKGTFLREAVMTASGVLANFGGVPLAFAWIATLGNAGLLTTTFGLGKTGFSLYTFWGLAIVYLYFSIPMMVLVMAPALDGLRPHWREAALNNGANGWQYWRYVGIPVLTPALIGGMVLLFGMAFSAYATAAAMVGATVPLVTLQIADALSGNVLVGHENLALALSLNMVIVAGIVMVIYLPLRNRSSRWLQ